MAGNYPEDLRYTKEHEWARLERQPDGGASVRVGITWYAQDALGDVVYVELPDPGTRVTQDAPFGEIQSPKAVSDLFAPVSGEIADRNSEVVSSPELVNEDAYGEGWLLLVRPDDPAELDALMDAREYASYVDSLEED